MLWFQNETLHSTIPAFMEWLMDQQHLSCCLNKRINGGGVVMPVYPTTICNTTSPDTKDHQKYCKSSVKNPLHRCIFHTQKAAKNSRRWFPFIHWQIIDIIRVESKTHSCITLGIFSMLSDTCNNIWEFLVVKKKSRVLLTLLCVGAIALDKLFELSKSYVFCGSGP